MDPGLSEKHIPVAATIALLMLAAVSLVYPSRIPHPGTVPETSRKIDAAREMIDPNTASVPSLCRLPGIGPVTANKIVACRRAHGSYATLDDLRKVRGIGPVTILKIENYLQIGNRGRQPGPGAERDD